MISKKCPDKAQEDKVVEAIRHALIHYHRSSDDGQHRVAVSRTYSLIEQLQSLGVIFPKLGEKWVQLDPDNLRFKDYLNKVKEG